MIKIYGYMQSGNCYKTALTCALLDIPYEWITIDILTRENRAPEFLAKNPSGKIPFMEIDAAGDKSLTESNAMVNYLARNSALMPTDNYEIAKVEQWQFFEQYSHEPNIAVARFIAKYLGLPNNRRDEYEAKQIGGNKALATMEAQLQQTPFLTGDKMTTADISLYGYTHVADEGGFELSQYPAIQTWLQRIALQPNYISMSD
jgi:glutathione S-transferase